MRHIVSMIAEEIRELQRAEKFEPYTVVTNDGKELYVKHPDYLFITPGNQTVYIYSTETAREIVAVANITRIAPGAPRSRTRRR